LIVLQNGELNVQVSDTTGDDSRSTARNKISYLKNL
jgi:hypothetical protein